MKKNEKLVKIQRKWKNIHENNYKTNIVKIQYINTVKYLWKFQKKCAYYLTFSRNDGKITIDFLGLGVRGSILK